MKLSRLFLATVALVMMVVSVVPELSAQQRRRGRRSFGGGDPYLRLLSVDAVKKELNITDEQLAAVKEIAKANRPARPSQDEITGKSEEERREVFKKIREGFAESAKKNREDLEEVLLPEQLSRIQEIFIQTQGVRALADKQVAEKLGITSQQSEELEAKRKEVTEEAREKMREMIKELRDSPEEAREKMLEFRTSIEQEVLTVLSEEQRSLFEELKGEPFDMPSVFGRQGGRGDRGDGEGRRRRPRRRENQEGGDRPLRPQPEA